MEYVRAVQVPELPAARPHSTAVQTRLRRLEKHAEFWLPAGTTRTHAAMAYMYRDLSINYSVLNFDIRTEMPRWMSFDRVKILDNVTISLMLPVY